MEQSIHFRNTPVYVCGASQYCCGIDHPPLLPSPNINVNQVWKCVTLVNILKIYLTCTVYFKCI